MRHRMSGIAAGLFVAFSLVPGEAEVLAIDSPVEINSMTTISDSPIVSGDIYAANGSSSGDFEVQSSPIDSHDAIDADHGTLSVTASPALPNWAMTLLSFTGFDR